MQRQIRPRLFPKSLICIICCVIIAISTSRATALEGPPDSSLSAVGLSDRQFENEVKAYLGTPYRRGGTTKKGFDCSGFARTVYDRILGIDIPHSSTDQFRSSELQKIDTRQLQTGDLVFFGSSKKKRINHVGVYLSDGQFIHASSSEGIIVSSLDDKYWKKRYVGSKRHTALTSSGKNDDLRFENYLELPVLQSGLLSYYSRDEFSPSPAMDAPDTINFDLLESYQAKDAPQSFHEISYSHTVADGFDISFSAFQEKLDSNAAWWTAHDLALFEDGESMAVLDTAIRRGVTLTTDYRPSSWLSITPSLTYFDNSQESEGLLAAPKRSLGVNTQLSPLDSSWSLSMLLQYTDGENLMQFDGFDNTLSSFDMAIKLGVSLTENLQFSIVSRHDKRSASLRMLDDSSLDQPLSTDIAMMFDFSY